jgi:hypothetical protein
VDRGVQLQQDGIEEIGRQKFGIYQFADDTSPMRVTCIDLLRPLTRV